MAWWERTASSSEDETEPDEAAPSNPQPKKRRRDQKMTESEIQAEAARMASDVSGHTELLPYAPGFCELVARE